MDLFLGGRSAAIISNATRSNQTIYTSSLEDLPEIAKSAKRPAILVFGDVVNHSNILPKYVTNIVESNKLSEFGT